jgi:hypothetical protein
MVVESKPARKKGKGVGTPREPVTIQRIVVMKRIVDDGKAEASFRSPKL